MLYFLLMILKENVIGILVAFLVGAIVTFFLLQKGNLQTTPSTEILIPSQTLSITPSPNISTIYPTIPQRTCRDENDCAGSPCVNDYCQGYGDGADCIDGFIKVCQAGICDCQKL